MITEWKVCRACGSPNLESVLNLGNLCLSTFLDKNDPPPPRAPLELVICGTCDLVQLRHSVEADQLFRKYWYRSGINEAMRAELADIVEQAQRRVGPFASIDTFTPADQVIDIGANDGTLLKAVGAGPVRIAFEPATNLYQSLRPHTEMLLPDYFTGAVKGFQAKAIFSIAMFYDLDDPHSFLDGIVRNLHPNGIWIVQFQDLLQMLHATAFDNICHEHVTCPSLTWMSRMMGDHGLQIVEAERRTINGGSLRLYVRHEGKQTPSDKVAELLSLETTLYRDLQQFAWRTAEVKSQLLSLLEEAAHFGPVDAYGASTKFSTLAQYCDLGPDLIRQCVERSPEKWGLTTVTGIPIVSEEVWRADPAPATLLAIWQFASQVLVRERSYLAEGGSFIIPLPHLEVIYNKLIPLEDL